MERRSWILSTLTLTVLTLFFIQGLYLLLVPIVPSWKAAIIRFLVDGDGFYTLGGGTLLLATLLFTCAFYITRHRYLPLVTSKEGLKAEVTLPLVASYLDRFWKEHLPMNSVQSKVAFEKNGTLSIKAELPTYEKEEELKDLERTLQHFLEKKLAYTKPIQFTLFLSND